MSFVQRAGIYAIALVLLSFGFSAVFAADQNMVPLDANGLPVWVAREWDDTPIRLELHDYDELARLLSAVPLSRFDREMMTPVWVGDKIDHIVLEPRVTAEELQALRDAGYDPVVVRDIFRENREAAEQQWAQRAMDKDTQVFSFPLTTYPTNAEIGSIIDDVVTAHPAIARKFQWGTTVQGRELWGVVISADVNNESAEPEVRLSSTMHGDEVVGMVMLCNLADYLTTNYGQIGYDDVTNLVDNYEIHIMPLHNPDGNAAGQRYNANSVDLNRNFPLPSGSHPTQEIENINYMSYANANDFVISINAHGGALVANYLWDYTYTLTPDNAALIELSLEYSTYNVPMYNGSFPQGITNGADWYVVDGSVQDWSYDQTGCIDTTMELSNTKWPSAGTLVGFWGDNRESLMHYTKAARYGVNGVVTGSDTGMPLDATITVTGNSKTVDTDPAFGDYYKLLDTGTYEISYSAPGYITQTISSVLTTWGTPTVLDVVLNPVAHGAIAGNVYEILGPPIAAQVDAYSHPLNVLQATTLSSAGDGSYSFPSLVYGDYRLVYTAAGHVTGEQLVTLDAANVTAPDISLAVAVEILVFSTDFEGPSSDGWTTTGTWGTIADGADGTTYAMTDSPSGSYGHGLDIACTMTLGVDLTELDEGELTYRAKWNIESNWDGCRVQVSLAGGAWATLDTPHTFPGSGQGEQISGEEYYEGSQATWITETIDLAPWLTETNVRFRFVLTTDGSVSYDGFTFDEFVIAGVGSVTTGVDNTPLVPARLGGVHPNPFNPTTKVTFELARDGQARIDVYDVTGRLVRTLLDGRVGAGEQSVRWDGRDGDGAQAASGLYFVRLRAAGVEETAKAVLVK